MGRTMHHRNRCRSVELSSAVKSVLALHHQPTGLPIRKLLSIADQACRMFPPSTICTSSPPNLADVVWILWQENAPVADPDC